MKKILLVVLALMAASVSMAAEALWLRYPAISPDGSTVAFSYMGDIYLVDAAGGEARTLVSHRAYDYSPIWSPDGTQIAFASDRHGNFDIFTIPVSGGEARRVTTHSNKETPWCFSPDGSKIYFSADLHTTAASRFFPRPRIMTQLYTVSVEGGRPQLVVPSTAEEVALLGSGEAFLYQDNKGENRWRKHHTSAVARDIWLYRDGKHTQLTTFAGENRVPRLAPDGKTVYYLSEQSGSFNVCSFPLDKPSSITQHTHHKTHPVRSLTLAKDGTLCYAYDGSIYLKRPNSEPSRLQVSVPEVAPERSRFARVTPSNNAMITPDDSQMIFTFRGELYVTTTDEEPATTRLTYTVATETQPELSPDGRTLVYASDRQGKWNIFQITLNRRVSNFMELEEPDETPLFADNKYDRTMPKFSPDGKELAFIEDRSRLMVMNLKTGAIRQLTDGSHCQHTGGSYPYSWSPDGKWILLSCSPNLRSPEICLVNTSKQEPLINLTQCGYGDFDPAWILGGEAILFRTVRSAQYDHARTKPATATRMILFLNRAAYERYKTPEKQHEALGLVKPAAEDIHPIRIELDGISERVVQLTKQPIRNMIVDREGKYAYGILNKKLARFDLATRKIKTFGAATGKLAMGSSGETLFVLDRKAQRFDIEAGTFSPITASGRYEIDRAAERTYMFDNIYYQVAARFYDKNLHGVDWTMYWQAYRRFLPHINNNYDFSEMASEWLGELNVSHTGLQYKPRQGKNTDRTAELGLFFDYNHTGDGLKVEEVLKGGPFDRSTSQIAAGDVIEEIDSVRITANMDYYPLLNKKVGKVVRVVVRKPSGERQHEAIIPINRATYNNLLYKRWMARNTADVERLSNGRLGYVHLKGMNTSTYTHLYSTVFGSYADREALIVDIRYNPGGNLHQPLETFFGGRQYWQRLVRNGKPSMTPSVRWARPSVMLIGEGCYSNSHGVPHMYDYLDLGTTVGTSVPGTMTAVNRTEQRDRTLSLGIPVVGFYMQDGTPLENTQLEPNVRAENDKSKMAQGRDVQLEATVQVLLKQLEANPQKPWKLPKFY